MEEDKATIVLSSPLSSPTHEFSFTITLHPSPNSSPNHMSHNNTTTSTSPSFALDLAPADDIFFHGHLLPLQLISRHSDLTVPPAVNHISATDRHVDNVGKRINNKPFWKKWLKPNHHDHDHDHDRAEEDHNKRRKRKTVDFSRFWKKYARLFSSEKRCDNINLRKPYSFSVNPKENISGKWIRPKRGRFSAPASRRTSPSNSSLLSVVPSSDDGSMEALQSAIQAAIAHCKDSTKVVRETDVTDKTL